MNNSLKFEQYANACLSYLIADPYELNNFMKLSGYDADMLRNNLATKSFKKGLIDYFATNEQQLLAMCTLENIDAQEFINFWQKLENFS